MFKLVLSFALVAVALGDVSHLFRGNQGGSFPARPPVHRPVASSHAPGHDAQAQILRSDSEIQPDGSYTWSYETDNGISAQEQAQIHQTGPETAAKNAQGSFSWTSPEGQPIQITYVADENGYQPQGDLPTPPPIPAAIQRALDWIAAHPQPEHQYQQQQQHQYQQPPTHHNAFPGRRF